MDISKKAMQIIRAGNGISHAEELNEKSEIFQIWFGLKYSAFYNKEHHMMTTNPMILKL